MNNYNILKTLSILYAEDDLVIQESISRILKIFFKEVFVTNDGNEALEIYQNNKILNKGCISELNRYLAD